MEGVNTSVLITEVLIREENMSSRGQSSSSDVLQTLRADLRADIDEDV